MADEAEAKQDDAQGGPSLVKRLLSYAMIGGVGILALGGGLVGAMGPKNAMALLTGGGAEAEVEAPKAMPEDPKKHPGATTLAAEGADAPGAVVVTPFKEIIVNITATTATGRQTTRFLKLNAALVYDGAAPGATLIEERKLFLRDSFQDYLRQLSERDLQGSIGLAVLKGELLRRARAISESQAPQEILISDLIVQ